jgi:hypothetical protein
MLELLIERVVSVRILTDKLKRRSISFAAIQETRNTRTTPNYASNGYHIYWSSKRDNHELGAFLVAQRWNHLTLNFIPIDERLCVLRLKGRFKNYSLINAHAPTNESLDDDKEEFYEKLSKAYNDCPRHDINIIVGDMNA